MSKMNTPYHVIAVLALLLLNPFGSYAQYYQVKAGANFGNARVIDTETQSRLSTGTFASINNYVSGIALGAMIKEKAFIQMGLDWNVKGYINKFSEYKLDFFRLYGFEGDLKVKTRLQYLSLPITAGYIFPVKNLNVYVEGGIFTALGIWGTENLYGTKNGEKSSMPIHLVFINDEMTQPSELGYVSKNRGDRGIILGTGLKVDEFLFGIQYQRSTRDCSTFPIYDIKNRSVSLQIAVNIDRKVLK
jgi:hypothetical protein